MAKPLTNCPNCGGVLDSLGHCHYCGTNAKIGTNVVDIGQFGECDITLNFRKGDNVYIYPLRGTITEMQFQFTTEPTTCFYSDNVIVQKINRQMVSFTFDGELKDRE